MGHDEVGRLLDEREVVLDAAQGAVVENRSGSGCSRRQNGRRARSRSRSGRAGRGSRADRGRHGPAARPASSQPGWVSAIIGTCAVAASPDLRTSQNRLHCVRIGDHPAPRRAGAAVERVDHRLRLALGVVLVLAAENPPAVSPSPSGSRPALPGLRRLAFMKVTSLRSMPSRPLTPKFRIFRHRVAGCRHVGEARPPPACGVLAGRPAAAWPEGR